MGIGENLNGFISELENRCARLIRLIKAKDEVSEISDLRHDAVKRLTHTFEELRDLKRDLMLTHEKLKPQAISQYQDLFRDVVIVEEILAPVLVGYDQYDRRGNQWLVQFASETNFPLDAVPFVTAKSGNYYWTYPDFRILGMPIGDIEGILGWADIVHELGHNLLSVRPDMLTSFTPIADKHFRDERDFILDLGGEANPRDSKWLNIARIKWSNKREGTWREELACDLIATYSVGAAYGWQHLRLATNRDNHPYHPIPSSASHTSTHPADHARMEAILSMLKIMKLHDEAKILERQWNESLNAKHFSKLPQGFRVYYPNNLLTALAKVIHEECKNIRFNSFNEQVSKNKDGIVFLVNEAWQQFQKSPNTYGTWEKATTHRFWAKLESEDTDRMIG